MTGHEFERKVRRLGRNRGVAVSFDDRFTTLKDRKKEIGPRLLGAMLHQLGLTRKDLED
jgi:hypothetical protein